MVNHPKRGDMPRKKYRLHYATMNGDIEANFDQALYFCSRKLVDLEDHIAYLPFCPRDIFRQV